MFNNNKILVVIPARGGSKGIPRKNIRLLNHNPLISYPINIAKSSEYVDDIVVTTDDSEIALLAEKFGASVIMRSEELSGDDVPLFDEYDLVVTLQPTSPLLEPSTLDAAIEKFEDFAVDSVLSVVDDRHLSWGYDEKNERYFPNYIERKNRQYLPKDFRETGALLITRRNFVHEDSRLGTNLDLIEVSRQESVDIDNFEDWWIAESIASKLVFHDVLFLMDEQHQLGIDIVDSYNYPFEIYDGEDDLIKILRKHSPQIVVNDIMDTSREYMTQLKEDGYFVVNFEDIGVGAEVADVVFDALYEHDMSEKNVFTGYKYYILDDEFYFQPQKVITPQVENVLIAFGGTDQNNFTETVIDSILATSYDGRINVILGVGYDGLERLIDKYESNQSVQIYRNVSDISEFMFKADLIFTSAGRTMYEVCSLGVPTICLCQDERELTHVFANETNGFINMGLSTDIEKQEIIDQFISLVNDYELRLEMNQKMLGIDLKDGFENIWAVIRGEYRKFELKGQKHENIQ